MKVLCVERDKARLKQMRKEARELVPDAQITVCRDPFKAEAVAKAKGCDVLLDPFKAEAVAKAKGCDVLLTDTLFDGRSLDGVMLAERIRLVNPRVNIIFITEHEDSLAAYNAWKLGASAFLLRPYEKQRLGKGIGRPALCVGMSAPVCNYIKHAAI